MARRSANLLLRVLGNGDDAKRALAAVKTDLRKFGSETATAVADVDVTKGRVSLAGFQRELARVAETVTAHVHVDAPTTAIERLRAELESLGRAGGDTVVDVQIQAAEARIERVRERLANLAKQPDSPEVQIRIGRAVAELDRLQTRLNALTARRAPVEIPVVVEDGDARAVIERVRAELTQFGTLSPATKLDVQIVEAQAAVETIRARIDELAGERPTVEVRAQVAQAIAELDRAEAKAADLNGKRAEIKVDVDRGVTGFLDTLTSSISGLFTALGSGGGGGLTGATTRVSAGFISFGAVVGPVAFVLAGLVVTIGVSLVAALAALAASLVAAVAAVGALGAALLGALGPGVALAIAVASRIAKVFAALKAQDAAAQQVGQKTAQGAGAARVATERQAAAAVALKDANEQLGRATTAAYREMADTAEAASDAVRGVGDARLSLDDARLSTREAELALKKLRGEANATGPAFDAVFKRFTNVKVDTSGLRAALAAARGSSTGGGIDGAEQELALERAILTVRQARQREKTAVDGVSDAERARGRALQTNTAFVRDGIAASQGYQAALRGVRDTQRQVNAATADPAVSAAQAKAITLVGDLTDRERQLLATIRSVRTELRGAFKGATDAVFGGMIRSLGRIPQLVNPLRGDFARLGGSISRSLDIFSRELIRPEWISAIQQFIAAGGRISQVFTADILIPFLRIVRDIALQALPFLESGLRRAGEALHGLSDVAGPNRLHDIVVSIVGQLRSWLGLVGQLSRVFLAFVTGGAGEGQKLVDTLTAGARRLADLLNSARGQNAIRQFFADVLPLAREFLEFIGLLIIGVLKFVQLVSPALAKVIGLFNDLVRLIGRVPGAFKIIAQATHLTPAITFFKALRDQAHGAGSDIASAMSGAAAAVKRADDDLADTQRIAAQAQRDLTDARKSAKDTLDDLASSAANAKLSERDARLSLTEARDQLAADKANGASAHQLARDRLSVAQAEQRVRDATREATRAKDESTEAHRKGIEGDNQVVAARKRVRDENKRVVDSEKRLAAATIKAAQEKAAAQAKTSQGGGGQSLLGKLGGVAETAVKLTPPGRLLAVTGLFDPVKNAAGDAIAFVASTVANIAGTVADAAPGIASAGADLIASLATGMASNAASIASGMGRIVSGALSHIGDFAARAAGAGADLAGRIASGIGSAAGTIARAVGGLITGAISHIGDFAGRIADAGASLGRRLAGGIRSGLSGLENIGKLIVNNVIGLFNRGIHLINKVTPGALKVAGHTVIPGIPDIPDIPTLALGGLARSATLAIFGEAGDEAVLPLDAATMRRLAGAIVAQLELPAPRITLSQPRPVAGAAAAAGGIGTHIAEQHLHLPPAPGGQVPDARAQAILFAREMRARGSGGGR